MKWSGSEFPTELLTASNARVDAAVINVFFCQDMPGTAALVLVTDQPPDAAELRRLSSLTDCEALCWVWREHTRPPALQVRCFNRGVPIRFCGHGLLASAYFLAQRTGERPTPLELHAEQAIYRVSSDSETGKPWLLCPPIATRSVSRYPTDFFQCAPMAGAVAGDKTGYWILRWQDGYDLGRLQPDYERICAAGGRAVIVTSRHEHAIQLRYFAPQYGNREDSVTGSACVVLMDYWEAFHARFWQRSQRPGILWAKRQEGAIAITGNLRVLQSVAENSGC